MKLFALTGIILLAVMPQTWGAEGEDKAKTQAQEVSEEVSKSQPPSSPERVVIRQPASVAGFQTLTVSGQTVAATYLEEKLGKRHGVVVMLPDQGEQIDNYGVIQALRMRLPLYGWATMTLAMHYPFEPNIFLAVPQGDASAAVPATNTSEAQPAVATPSAAAGKQATADKSEKVQQEKTADNSQAAQDGKDKEDKPETQNKKNAQGKAPLPPVDNRARIEAALAFVQEKNIERIILLGHGEGGQLAIKMLDKLKTPVRALILIGTGQLDAETENIFATFDMPVLDIAGSRESAAVLRAQQRRQVIMKRHQHDQYNRKEVVGADHFFTGVQDNLTQVVRGWLRRHFVEKGNQ